MSVAFSRSQIEAIAALAHLRLDDEEIELYSRQLGDILDYANQVQNIDTTGLSPTGPPMRSLQRMMFGSGSNGNETWSAARSWSAFFDAAMRAAWSVLVSTSASSGSAAGTLIRDRLFPVCLFFLVGMAGIEDNAVARLERRSQRDGDALAFYLRDFAQVNAAFLAEAGMDELLVVRALEPAGIETAGKGHFHGVLGRARGEGRGSRGKARLPFSLLQSRDSQLI